MQTDKLAKVASLDHVNILTNDIDACRRFYINILGFVKKDFAQILDFKVYGFT